MKDALLWNEIGNLYLKIGSTDDAIAAITKAIELDPDSGWFPYNLGLAYYQTGEFGSALFLFQKSIHLLKASKDQAVVWNKIGDAYRAVKEIDNAIQAYKKADELEMGASLTELNLEMQTSEHAGLLDMIRKEKVIPVATPLSSTPAKVEASVKLQAEVEEVQYGNAGKNEELNILPSVEPDTQPCRSAKSERTSTQETSTFLPVDQQNASWDALEEENPPLPGKKTIIVIPDPNGMEKNVQEQGNPNHEPEQVNVSITESGKNEIQDARSEDHTNIYPGIENLEEILAKVHIYENITQVNPTNDRAWDTLGKLYKSLGRFKDAIVTYKKAIEIAPEREVYYYYLGLLYAVEQQHEEAVQAFQHVLKQNPDYILAHSALAGVYHRMGQETKANHHIAIALPQMNNESAYNRACFSSICGDTNLALEFLHLALKNKDTMIEWIKSDPDLDPLRTNQRFQELVSGIEQPVSENVSENYFSCELEGSHNRLLPILNHSLAR
jgi:tetratricopeptide (TPR) repeat protein